MRKTLSILLSFFYLGCGNPQRDLEHWLTDPKEGIIFQKMKLIPREQKISMDYININQEITYQTMDGFGFTLSQGSAKHLIAMRDPARKKLLNELFGKEENQISISYLRLSIGASDLNEFPFSYNELPDSLEADLAILYFDFGSDKLDVLPILKEIMAINPHIKLMASPWSPPIWMKNNKNTRGGSLLPEFEDAYARYLVKYVQEMANEGFQIDALTIQNEPLHPENNPSLLMFPEQQARFIGLHLGPAFQAAGIKTKLIIYDHNADRPDYPISVLNDSIANPFIDGSAFHLYGGTIDALSKVHQAHPDKNLYFTEQWIGAPGNLAGDLPWHTKNLIIGASRNWAKTVLEWNLTSNPTLTPHTDQGGCDRCLGAVTIDGDDVIRNPAYYIIGHASKFVEPNSLRIDSNLVAGLPNVAFLRPDGKKVLIVLNETSTQKTFTVKNLGKEFMGNLNPGAVGTWIW